jgi:hypothetical protein
MTIDIKWSGRSNIYLPLFLLLIISLNSVSAFAADPDDPYLTYFDGGVIDINMNISSQLVSGIGISSISTGRAAPSSPDPFSLFRNPAGMRFIRRDAAFGMTFHPQARLEFESFPFIDIQESVNEGVDTFAETFNTTDDFIYPEFGGSVAEASSSLTSFGIVLPTRKWRVGFGYCKPINLQLDFLLNGFRQRIDTVEDEPSEEVAFAIQTKVSSRLNIDADSWTVALSRDFGRRFSFGASVSRTILSINILGGYNVDGLMTKGTSQNSFNSVSDPWYNTLHTELNGGYSGSIWSTHIGFIWASESDKGWRFGSELTLYRNQKLKGRMKIIIDEFPALILTPKEGEDSFDINALEPTELTRTNPNEILVADWMKFTIPNSASFTLSRGSGIRPNFNFIYYFGDDFAYTFDVHEKRYEDIEYAHNVYSRGLKLKYQGYLGINPGWFFIGMGAIVAEDVVLGYKDGDGIPEEGGNMIPIPRFDMGIIFNISSNLRYELMIAGLPEDVLRMGVIYEF